jgi:hypothetical protein
MKRRCEPGHLPGTLTGDPAAHDVIAGHYAELRQMTGFRNALSRAEATPSWMRADLARLQAAFPAFSFAIRRGLRGFTFEAWRDPAAGGLYAVITDDLRELWRELERTRR